MDELERGNRAILDAVLLSRLPSLKSLEIDTAYQRLAVFLQTAPEPSLNLSPLGQRFPLLERVRLNSEGFREGDYDKKRGRVDFHDSAKYVDGTHLSSLISLPSMKILDMSVPKGIDMQWSSDSSITSLTFTQSRLSIKSLGKLLSVTPSLRHLEYHRVLKDSFELFPRPNTETIDCIELLIALAAVASTLEVLKLSFGITKRADDMNRSGCKGVRSVPGFLLGFKMLTSVVLPITLLLDHKLDLSYSLATSLPLNSRQICLTDDLCDLETHNLTPKLKPWVEHFVLGQRRTYLEKFTIEHRFWTQTAQSQTVDCHAMSGKWYRGQTQLEWSEGHRLMHRPTGE